MRFLSGGSSRVLQRLSFVLESILYHHLVQFQKWYQWYPESSLVNYTDSVQVLIQARLCLVAEKILGLHSQF